MQLEMKQAEYARIEQVKSIPLPKFIFSQTEFLSKSCSASEMIHSVVYGRPIKMIDFRRPSLNRCFVALRCLLYDRYRKWKGDGSISNNGVICVSCDSQVFGAFSLILPEQRSRSILISAFKSQCGFVCKTSFYVSSIHLTKHRQHFELFSPTTSLLLRSTSSATGFDQVNSGNLVIGGLRGSAQPTGSGNHIQLPMSLFKLSALNVGLVLSAEDK